ncbi:MAG: hypothetical protein U0V74_11725 [Chitinophagales bacterium]
MDEYSERRKGHETWTSKLFRIVNSTVCFALAYVVITYLSWLAMALVGKFFKCDAIVYFYGIKFITPVAPELFWNKLRVILIYSSGPVFALLFGLLCMYVYDKTKHLKTVLNLFLVWGFVVGSAIFVSQGVIAALGHNEYNSPYYVNLAVVFAWLRIPVFFVYVFNLPFLILFLFLGTNAVRPFLKFAYSYTKINKMSRRRRYYIETAVVPFILGAMGIIFMKYYIDIVHDMFVQLVYFLAIFFMMVLGIYSLQHAEVLKDDVLKYKVLQQINVVFPLLLIGALAIIYITRQGLYISFN